MGGPQSPPHPTAIDTEQIRNVQDSERYGTLVQKIKILRFAQILVCSIILRCSQKISKFFETVGFVFVIHPQVRHLSLFVQSVFVGQYLGSVGIQYVPYDIVLIIFFIKIVVTFLFRWLRRLRGSQLRPPKHFSSLATNAMHLGRT